MKKLNRLVLGCIEAKFCKYLVNTRWKALAEIYTMPSDHLFLDLFAESSTNLRKLIDLDRELVSNFSEFHGWALNDDAFGFDDLD